jgi:hypothetical protein
MIRVLLPFCFVGALLAQHSGPAPTPTREFEIRADRAFLGGEPIEIWGVRCGNALHSATVTERHVRAFDTWNEHGINAIGVYIQGSNGGYPNVDAGLNGFDRDGSLKPAVAQRLEWLVREADRRGMVVMVGIFSPRKDQLLDGPAAVRRALEQTAAFLVARGLRNVFIDIAHEYDHTERMDLELFREPGGEGKKALMTRWFKAVAPDIEVGVCPYEKSTTTDAYPGMDVRIVQKAMPIPAEGFVVNVESTKRDAYENDGVFSAGGRDEVLADCERYLAAPNAALFFHAAYVQGITNFSGTAPHAEPGGMGTGPADRGVRFYFEWVRDRVGRWSYPRHVPVSAPTAVDGEPTREFEILDGMPHLGSKPVKLWGLRCDNALLAPAVTERLIHNLDNLCAHGINLISLSLQGTDGGFPDVDAGPNAFTPDGRLIKAFGERLEAVVRAADRRGMVVLVGILVPRKDEHLVDEAAVRQAIESTARLLESRGLRNVFVNLVHEFDHPTRIHHEILREPEGEQKKSRLAGWFHAIAPRIELGIVSTLGSGPASWFPGADLHLIHADAAIPPTGFVVNAESPFAEPSGNEGVAFPADRRRQQGCWQQYAQSPRLALLYRSPYVEDVTGRQGTGPNFEMGGNGKGESDRGIRFYFEWVRAQVGVWGYPTHQAQ